MEIKISQNLKKLRKDKNMTQEELAAFLGISFQAVSKWERDEGYPDITMLPVIANYFGVTVDELIGNDLASKKEKINNYLDEYWHLNQTSNSRTRIIKMAQKAYSEYPYEWSIIDIYILSLTRVYTELPGEKLPELRSLCKMVMDKCHDDKIRVNALYSMLFAEDDDRVNEWFDRVSVISDFFIGELMEDRYLKRGQMDKFLMHKQENIRSMFDLLYEKVGKGITTPEETIDVEKCRIALCDTLLDNEDMITGKRLYAYDYANLAAAYFACSRKEEGYSALKKAVEYYLEWLTIPPIASNSYSSVKSILMKRGSFFSSENKLWIFEKGSKLLSYNFDSVYDEERYQEIIGRSKK